MKDKNIPDEELWQAFLEVLEYYPPEKYQDTPLDLEIEEDKFQSSLKKM